jgi:MFS transporter, DHA2 family, methylenomycin A resistance protein
MMFDGRPAPPITVARDIAGRPARDRLTLMTLCAAVLIAQLDTSVVNLGVRPIGEFFRADVNALQWVVDSYNMAYASLLLTAGVLADLLGRRLVFMAGAALFCGASLLCAAAPAVWVLMTGRTLAGAGAALLLPASLAIIRVAWPDEQQRARALGIWAACNGLAFAIGPTLGGLLIHRFGWRSVFLVVVPVALAALIATPWTVPESSDPHHRDFDVGGQVPGALVLASLTVAAIESTRAVGIAVVALVVAVASLMLFARVERSKGPVALVPLDLFAMRRFRASAIATCGMTFGMYGTIFLLPLVWQSAGRLSPVEAGIALAPMACVFLVISPFSGALAERLGTRAMTTGGVSIIGSGLLVIGLSAGSVSIVGAEAGLFLTGIGMGLATGPLMAAAVGSVPAKRAGTAASLINVARMAGATIGVAALGALFAAAGGGPRGLSHAMLFGGLSQLAAAAIAWRITAGGR